jgi:hypothetical protein
MGSSPRTAGTLDEQRVVRWAAFCTAFVEAFRTRPCEQFLAMDVNSADERDVPPGDALTGDGVVGWAAFARDGGLMRLQRAQEAATVDGLVEAMSGHLEREWIDWLLQDAAGDDEGSANGGGEDESSASGGGEGEGSANGGGEDESSANGGRDGGGGSSAQGVAAACGSASADLGSANGVPGASQSGVVSASMSPASTEEAHATSTAAAAPRNQPSTAATPAIAALADAVRATIADEPHAPLTLIEFGDGSLTRTLLAPSARSLEDRLEQGSSESSLQGRLEEGSSHEGRLEEGRLQEAVVVSSNAASRPPEGASSWVMQCKPAQMLSLRDALLKERRARVAIVASSSSLPVAHQLRLVQLFAALPSAVCLLVNEPTPPPAADKAHQKTVYRVSGALTSGLI